MEIEELESLLGPDDTDADFRRNFEEARDEKGCAIFEAFSTGGPSDFGGQSFAMGQAPKEAESTSVERQWQEGLEEQRVGWSSLERKVMECSGRLLGKMRPHKKVDIELLERLMEPENEEVSPRDILKYSTRGGSNMFQLFDTAEKKDHFVTSRKRWLESQGKKATKQECWQNEWHDIKYHVVMAKALPCPERTLKTPLPQQSSPSSRKKAGGSLWKTGDGGVSLSKRRLGVY